MKRAAVFIQSDDGPPPEPLIAAGCVRVARQVDLSERDLLGACGLITTVYLDQIDFAARRDAIRDFLAGGGRIVFNGHVARPFVEGMRPFAPLASQRRADLALERLTPHPVFEGIPASVHATQKGVAGFYGRGHNPPLHGATSLTGIGPEKLPVDWEWLLAGGGGLFVHAGNDIWGTSDDPEVNALIAERLVAWSLAGQTERAAA